MTTSALPAESGPWDLHGPLGQNSLLAAAAGLGLGGAASVCFLAVVGLAVSGLLAAAAVFTAVGAGLAGLAVRVVVRGLRSPAAHAGDVDAAIVAVSAAHVAVRDPAGGWVLYSRGEVAGMLLVSCYDPSHYGFDDIRTFTAARLALWGQRGEIIGDHALGVSPVGSLDANRLESFLDRNGLPVLTHERIQCVLAGQEKFRTSLHRKGSWEERMFDTTARAMTIELRP